MMLSEKLTTRPSRSGRLFVVLMAALAVAVALSMAIAGDAGAQKIMKSQREIPTNGGGKPAPTVPTCTNPRPPGDPGGTTVKDWGANWNGQLGVGTNDDSNTPVQVQNLSGVRTTAGGGGHSLALMEDCTVFSWGDNENGQLGDGTITNRGTPVKVQNLSGVKAIAADAFHSLALKSDGTVFAWGWNGYGQLGTGSPHDHHTPVQIQGLSGVKAISAGANHSLALKEDGTVFAWGWNGYGQLGDGTTTDRFTPVQVQGLSGVNAISAGGRHNLALMEDGTVRAWGWNAYGQLGTGVSTGESPNSTPVQVKGDPPTNGQALLPWDYLSGVKAIDAGSSHSMALMADGTVRAWGANSSGQLGDGTGTYRNRPVKVQNLSGVTAIAAGTLSHSLALKTDGTVFAWGWNDEGQLGDGTNDDHNTPVQVQNLSGVQAISAGGSHSLAKVRPAQP